MRRVVVSLCCVSPSPVSRLSYRVVLFQSAVIRVCFFEKSIDLVDKR